MAIESIMEPAPETTASMPIAWEQERVQPSWHLLLAVRITIRQWRIKEVLKVLTRTR